MAGFRELVLLSVAAIIATLIALFADPLPPLEEYVESEGWTKFFEGFGLWVVAVMVLSLLGFVRAKLQIGPGGIAAERVQALDASSDAALSEVREANVGLAGKVEGLEAVVEMLRDQQSRLDGRIDAHLAALSRVPPAPPTPNTTT